MSAADAAGVDWRLPVAMGVLESSSGRQACGGNAWGLGSCVGDYGSFTDFGVGIQAVMKTLASKTYAGLSARGVLCMWVAGDSSCPDAHSQEYAAKGLRLMEGLR